MRMLLTGSFLVLASSVCLAEEPKVLNADASFPEGPIIKDGTLYYAEYGAHKVSAWDGTSNRTYWSKDGCGPSAVVPLGEGFAVTCYDSGENGAILDKGRNG
jgi:gluconolactonase